MNQNVITPWYLVEEKKPRQVSTIPFYVDMLAADRCQCTFY
jgi:hypothetical protein